MNKWSEEQCAFAVKSFWKNGNSYILAQCEFRKHFAIDCNYAIPSAHAIKIWVQNFEVTSSTLKKKGGSVKTACTPENNATVREAFMRSPTRSARRYSVTLELLDRSVRRILCYDLKFYPYNIQMSDEAHFHLSRFAVGIIGPYFFENNRGRTVTVNA
ncbi:hypothetical protein C0J52_24889 [Blattella germanica]|nr:hypothetical protein C0J52_24889 [Blattella germanica]